MAEDQPKKKYGYKKEEELTKGKLSSCMTFGKAVPRGSRCAQGERKEKVRGKT